MYLTLITYKYPFPLCRFFLEHFFDLGGGKKNCALGPNFMKSGSANTIDYLSTTYYLIAAFTQDRIYACGGPHKIEI
jgi:hypothetical protein